MGEKPFSGYTNIEVCACQLALSECIHKESNLQFPLRKLKIQATVTPHFMGFIDVHRSLPTTYTDLDVTLFDMAKEEIPLFPNMSPLLIEV